MSKYDLVTPAHVRQLLAYDPDTGLFTWRPRGLGYWDTRYAGKPALTTVCKDGYQTGVISSKRFYAHRVAIAHVTGAWPEGEVDHVNHDRLDNRIANLRVVDRTGNRRNLGTLVTNQSGVCGVHWAQHISKWVAQIGVDGGRVYLGAFDDLEEASAIRKQAELKYGFHPNHGKIKGARNDRPAL
jgi:hypothetical protein